MMKLEPVEKVLEVLNQSCQDSPADELIRMGECLIKLGKILKPLSRVDAMKVMSAVQKLV